MSNTRLKILYDGLTYRLYQQSRHAPSWDKGLLLAEGWLWKCKLVRWCYRRSSDARERRMAKIR